MNTDKKLLHGVFFMIALIVAPIEGYAQGMPASINLDTLVQYYEPVVFNHARHVELSKDCAMCHHHAIGMPVEKVNCIRCHKNSEATAVVSCRGCHSPRPFSADNIKESRKNTLTYHKDKLGLRGAYHQTCRGCHAAYGAATGCQDCHLRKKEGEALYNADKFARKLK